MNKYLRPLLTLIVLIVMTAQIIFDVKFYKSTQDVQLLKNFIITELYDKAVDFNTKVQQHK